MKSPSSKPVAVDTASPGFARQAVTVSRDGVVSDVDDAVAVESPLALVYNDQPHVVMMVTPQDFEDFVIGFSLSEGIVDAPSDVVDVRVQAVGSTPEEGYQADIRIAEQQARRLTGQQRQLAGRSGCGLCGAQSIAAAVRPPRRVSAGLRVDDAALRRALEGLRGRQLINAATGATHAAGWASPSGDLLLVREDVGRHNALDKLLGALARQGTNMVDGFAVVTSRASYEMVAKAAARGVGLLAAVSAPTTLAVRFAEDAGLTLVGFARGSQYVIYACAGRVQRTEPEIH